ncbi:hypothetical protein KI387_031538, partial [Taxus chinensis]
MWRSVRVMRDERQLHKGEAEPQRRSTGREPRWAETSSSRCFELDRQRSGGTAGLQRRVEGTVSSTLLISPYRDL